MARILGIGDSVVDVNRTARRMYPGGQTQNAVVNARLCGVEAGLITVFGNDDAARHTRTVLAGLGVELSRARTVPFPHATAAYQLVGGERVFDGADLADWYDSLSPFQLACRRQLGWEGFSDADYDYIRGFDWIHSSNSALLEHRLPALAARTGLPISFDLSTRGDDPGYLAAVCPFCTVALLSCGHLSEEATRARLAEAHALGARLALGTRGGDGAWLFDGAGFYHQPPQWVPQPVDTMGAGDAFIGAFVAHLLLAGYRGQGPAGEALLTAALSAAAARAADACMVEGAGGFGAPVE